MHFDEYNADGLRFDLTRDIDGGPLSAVMLKLRQEYPTKYFIAEHHPADRWITTFGNFSATWQAEAHHEAQRALNGDSPVDKIGGILGNGEHHHHWNLVKYLTGCHDDIGDQHNGDAEEGNKYWDKRHRYFVDLFGGRHNFYARAKARLAWALNIAMPGTPMLFMGTETHMGAPEMPWGYWHDGFDNNGDHRFDWSIAGDPTAIPMRRFVAAANRVRWDNPALRSETPAIITQPDHDNNVLAFKRWSSDGNVVLTVVNLSDTNFTQPQLRREDRRPIRPLDADPLHARRRLRRLGRCGQCVSRAGDASGWDDLYQPAAVGGGDDAVGVKFASHDSFQKSGTMDVQIIDVPIRFSLFGLSARVENHRYGPVGLQLMDAVWKLVKEHDLRTTGINHWVYLPADVLFVGIDVQASNDSTLPMGLKPLAFELRRYLKHLHVGPYDMLPQKWADLKALLATSGESPSLPSLEIYGHACEDPNAAETTILMGLETKPTT